MCDRIDSLEEKIRNCIDKNKKLTLIRRLTFVQGEIDLLEKNRKDLENTSININKIYVFISIFNLNNCTSNFRILFVLTN